MPAWMPEAIPQCPPKRNCGSVDEGTSYASAYCKRRGSGASASTSEGSEHWDGRDEEHDEIVSLGSAGQAETYGEVTLLPPGRDRFREAWSDPQRASSLLIGNESQERCCGLHVSRSSGSNASSSEEGGEAPQLKVMQRLQERQQLIRDSSRRASEADVAPRRSSGTEAFAAAFRQRSASLSRVNSSQKPPLHSATPSNGQQVSGTTQSRGWEDPLLTSTVASEAVERLLRLRGCHVAESLDSSSDEWQDDEDEEQKQDYF